ncbi:MAG: ComF family protein [Desulfobacterales bacterium]
MFPKSVVRIGRCVSNAIFPMTCAACGRLIDPGANVSQTETTDPAGLLPETVFRQTMKEHLCQSCLENFTPLRSPCCTRCGEPFKSRLGEDHLCSDCITRKKHFVFARAFAVYEGAILELIHTYKYKGRTRLAKPLAALLYDTFIRHFSKAGIDTAIAVPLHEKRLRNRGFNQAHLMIRHWHKILQDNTQRSNPEITVETGSLVRRKNTVTQTGLERSQRIKNIKNAFAVKSFEQIAGKTVLLVDDVFTTGSTVEECARVLDNAGAAGIYVLTLARAV